MYLHNRGTFFFFCFDINSLGCSHFGSLSTNEEQKRLVRDVMYTAATYARHFRDVIDLVRMVSFTVVFSRLAKVDF